MNFHDAIEVLNFNYPDGFSYQSGK